MRTWGWVAPFCLFAGLVCLLVGGEVWVVAQAHTVAPTEITDSDWCRYQPNADLSPVQSPARTMCWEGEILAHHNRRFGQEPRWEPLTRYCGPLRAADGWHEFPIPRGGDVDIRWTPLDADYAVIVGTSILIEGWKCPFVTPPTILP